MKIFLAIVFISFFIEAFVDNATSSPTLSDLKSVSNQTVPGLSNRDNAIQHTDLEPNGFEVADLPGDYEYESLPEYEVADHLPGEYETFSEVEPEQYRRGYDDGRYRRRGYDDGRYRRRRYSRGYDRGYRRGYRRRGYDRILNRK
ncbi:10401_t:CDS:2 [Ambispora leptoticha]|uniref:10401_t:CDS:1 n=1 Tax=Ambispora leptoticha TaxID=144679 RepID=A0A9N9GWM9_9GLOM|nr:10401_t:CDS:2 [Ambispora leptoticha]